MAILGQNYRQRRRPMGPLILIVLAVLIVAFLVFAYSRGGEVPTARVEKQIAMPSAATSDGGMAQPEG
ncbi:hypothetical protein [Blastomonas sp.]|uniref:hypothetical protein n=1 Tax=Blastomonas sp. TaxID=1909299 RepID=UPI00262467F2|nr:hypothetical protein [Blastomonas sp.]MDM7956349.1 hypothetical protein [Blastomonas sp.]